LFYFFIEKSSRDGTVLSSVLVYKGFIYSRRISGFHHWFDVYKGCFKKEKKPAFSVFTFKI